MKKAKLSHSERRIALREELWPGSQNQIWSAKEDGFCSMPRTVPLIATLISELTPRIDPARVYVDLWARNFNEGIVEVTSEADMAACCGFASGTPTVRSWQERMAAIEHLGFIKVTRKGTRKFGYVLMLHPHDCVQNLKQSGVRKIPDWWWDLYTSRLRETGAPTR